jgi:hypothetical protein
MVLLSGCGVYCCFGGEEGLKEEKGGCCMRLWTGAAPLTAAGEAAGRGEEAGRHHRYCAGAAQEEEEMTGVF